MIKVPTDQALERWDTLPLDLREALYFEPNSDFLWKTCEDQHIPDEKIYDASRISGYVLMGFLHPEDVAEELQEAIGIDPKTAKTIEAALNQRIFAPLRKSIDSVYKPLSKSEVGPQIIQEIVRPQAIAPKPPMPTPRSIPVPTPVAPGPKPQIISQTFEATPKFSAAPLAGSKNITTSTPAPNPDTNNAGWSKQIRQEPVVKLGSIAPIVPAATQSSLRTPAAPTTPVPTKPATPPAGRVMSEFERLDMMKKNTSASVPAAPTPAQNTWTAPKPPAPSTAPQSAPAKDPAPVMLHEVSPDSVQKSSDFHFQMNAQVQMNARPETTSVKPAVLEFGGAQPSAPQAPKVVRYTEYKAPAAPPAPATPPRPAQPPTPPHPTKVIVKDFLDPQK